MSNNRLNPDRTSYNCVAPPENINQRQQRVDINSLPVQKYGKTSNNKFQKRILKDDDDYFNDDEDEELNQPLTTIKEDQQQNEDDEEEDDPLDAFMASIQEEVKNCNQKSKQQPILTKPTSSSTTTTVSTNNNKLITNKKELKGVRGDIDEEDIEESYYKYMEENPNAGLIGANNLEDNKEDQIIDYDEDGNPIYKKVKYIDPLPSIDHSQITYSSFSKNFYIEHEDIANLHYMQIKDLRTKLNVKVSGAKPPKPVSSFAHFNFDEQLMKIIRRCEYIQPTPIQAQGIPVVLSGRDLIGIAKTGSGKTAAFIWPMLVHIMDQSDLKPGDGPIGLILAPTRELSQQIYTETKKFAKAYNIRTVCAYGGGSKWEQQKDLEIGAEIVIATPGRLIDLVKCKSTNLNRVTMLVLDEADRQFSLGFEAQVRSICDHCRPDKQTLMFSATFKKKIERLARDVLIDPIRIVQGELGEANQDVSQRILVFQSSPTAKWDWLTSKLTELTSTGSVLIFVTQKSNADELSSNLKARDFQVEAIHGDYSQFDRNKIITKFKKKEVNILIATDIAARGLDIPHIRTVINYDLARDIDTHTHRIGRTGRAGVEGVAYTLVTEKDKELAGHLVRNLESANQEVPEDLMKLALQSQWFKKARYKDSQAKKLNVKLGLGYKPDQQQNSSTTTNKTVNDNNSSLYFSNKYQSSSSHSSQSSNQSVPQRFFPPPTKQYQSTPQSRLEATRASYASQFASAFRPAAENNASLTVTNINNLSSSNNNNNELTTNQTNNQQQQEPKKKKSRWQ